MNGLEKWRKSQALSMAEAARRVSVSRQAWHKWETMARVPHARFRMRLRSLTGKDWWELAQHGKN